MIDYGPLNAYPLPGTSRFLTSERELCAPPPYAAQQAPPPYPPCKENDTTVGPSTRSIPFGPGVTFDWNFKKTRSPDDIIIVTVRINQLGRRDSFDGPLPDRYARPDHSCTSSQHVLIYTSRPQRRGFLRRLSSRLTHTHHEWENLRAVRMPRREYLRHHKRDEEGNYAGTELQQVWDDAMLEACYGRYQRSPLVPNGLYHNAAM